jgi:hypothetical protein
MRCALPMEFIESMKFLGIAEYAGGAHAMRPYPRILWGILGLANAKTSIPSIRDLAAVENLEHPITTINGVNHGISHQCIPNIPVCGYQPI